MISDRFSRRFLLFPLLLLVSAVLMSFSGIEKERKTGLYAAAIVIPQAADPVVNELENTTGSAITITRQAAGRYRVQSDPPVFTVGRVTYSVEYYNMGPSTTVLAAMRCIEVAYCDISIMSADPFGNSQYFYDGGTNGQFIPVRIEVYP